MGRGRETLRFGGKVHITERFERHRIRDPNDFIEGSFRTHDIGKKGFSKRIAGRLKGTGEWATQSLLISRDEPPAMKKQLRRNAENMLVWSKESPELKTVRFGKIKDSDSGSRLVVKAEYAGTVADLKNRHDLGFVSDSQDVEVVKDQFGHSPEVEDFDAFFVKVGNGEYSEVYGIEGTVPYFTKSIYRVALEYARI